MKNIVKLLCDNIEASVYDAVANIAYNHLCAYDHLWDIFDRAAFTQTKLDSLSSLCNLYREQPEVA